MGQFDNQQADIQRQQMIAQALMAGGNIPLSRMTQTAGGLTVPISKFEGLAALGKGLGGAYLSQNAQSQQNDLNDQKNDAAQQQLSGIISALAGPSQMGQATMPQVPGGPSPTPSLDALDLGPLAGGSPGNPAPGLAPAGGSAPLPVPAAPGGAGPGIAAPGAPGSAPPAMLGQVNLGGPPSAPPGGGAPPIAPPGPALGVPPAAAPQPGPIGAPPLPTSGAPMGGVGPLQMPGTPVGAPVEQNQRRAQLMAALNGMDPATASAALLPQAINRLIPEPKGPYTLKEGEVRYNADDTPVATGAPKEAPAGDRDIINIVDKTNPAGYRSIPRSQFASGDQLYEKPTVDPYNITPAQQPEVDKLAKMVYNLQLAPASIANRGPVGAAVMAKVGDMAAADGKVYDASDYGNKVKTENNFGTGKQGDSVRSFDVMLDHLGQLKTAGGDLTGTSFPAVNKLGNWFTTQTGGAAPASFNAIKNVVGAEVTKALVGGQATEADRQAAKAEIDAANSPTQLNAVITKYQQVGAAQLSGLKRQYTEGTQFPESRFNAKLSPAAQALVATQEGTGTPATPSSAAAAPTEGATSVSKSGKPMVFSSGHWQYAS